MLAAGLGLGLIVGLGLAGLTSTLVAALHVGSARLLAGFDALSGVPHARPPEELADFQCMCAVSCGPVGQQGPKVSRE